MNTINSNLLSTSSNHNSCTKRLISQVTEESVSNCKRNKSNSQEEINDAVQASNGYMTRNKLKKQLADKNDFKTNESLEKSSSSSKEDKSIIQPRKTKKSKKPRNKKTMQHSYDINVFESIVSFETFSTSFKEDKKSLIQPRNTQRMKKSTITNKTKPPLALTFDSCTPQIKNQSHTQHEKIPSLFESDSETEIDCFQIYCNKNNKVKEPSAMIPEIEDIGPVFKKNAEIKTYINKKSNIINSHKKEICSTINNSIELNSNVVNTTIITEELLRHLEQKKKNSISKGFNIMNCLGNNYYNENITIANAECVKQSYEDLITIDSQDYTIENQFISSESNISQETSNCLLEYKNNINPSLKTTDEVSFQYTCDTIKTEEIKPETFTDEINGHDFIKNENLNFSLDDESNQLKNLTISNCVEQSINNEDTKIATAEFIRQSDEDLIRNHLQDYTIENQFESGNNIFNQEKGNCFFFQNTINSNMETTDEKCFQNVCDTIKHKKNNTSETLTNAMSDFHNNGNLNFKIDKSNKLKYLQFDSKCCCQTLFNFNNDANKILISKKKHFAFDDIKNRQKLLKQKQLEANILEQLITECNKSIIQSERPVSHLNSTLSIKSQSKLIDVNENNHIEPNILQMLKDVYVGVEYMSEIFDCNQDVSDDELDNMKSNIKINFEASIPQDNLSFIKSDNIITSNITIPTNKINKPETWGKNNLDLCLTNKYDVTSNIIKSTQSTDNCKSYEKHVDDVGLAQPIFIHNDYKTIKKSSDIDKLFMENFDVLGDNISTSNVTTPTKEINNPEPLRKNEVHLGPSHSHDVAPNIRILQCTDSCKPSEKNIVKVNLTQPFFIHNDYNISNNEIINKPSDLYDLFPENCDELGDNASLSNIRISKKETNIPEPLEKENVYLSPSNKHQNINTKTLTSDFKHNMFSNKNNNCTNINTLNVSTTKHPIDISKMYKENKIHTNLIKNNNIINTSNFPIAKKSIDIPKLGEENNIHLNYNINNNTTFISSIETYKPTDDIKLFREQNDITDCNINAKPPKEPIHKTIPTVDNNFHFSLTKDNGNICILNAETNNHINTVKLFKEENDNLEDNSLSNGTKFNDNIINPKPYENINTEIKTTDIKIKVDDIIDFKKNNKYNSGYDAQSRQYDIPQYMYDTNFDGIHTPKPIELLNSYNTNKIDAISKQQNSNLFNTFDHDIKSDISSDDDCYKLLIDDADGDQLTNYKIKNDNVNNGNQLMNSEKQTIKIENDYCNQLINVTSKKLNTTIKNDDGDQLMNAKKPNIKTKNNYTDQLINVNAKKPNIKIKNAIKSTLPVLCNTNGNTCAIKEEQISLPDYNTFMTIEKCNEFYKQESLNNSKSFNKKCHFSKTINDIFSEVYVDTIFVSNCQHMVELCDDQLRNVELMNIKTQNDQNKLYKEFDQSIPINTQPITEIENNTNDQQNNKPGKPISALPKFNFLQKLKSNIHIRTTLRELLNSKQPMSVILKSSEFKTLSSFCEEEIASTIGVLLFENIFNPPIITGLPDFDVHYNEMNVEEKNELLRPKNLNMICPKVMKLTSITIELVKILKNYRLVDLILNIIRNNLLNKRTNINFKIDHQLITQIIYFIDICSRLGMLKYLQTFIFDSMVLLPNKYCCVIFMSLVLWKNCLPIKINSEQDPVLVIAISYLIAKRKSYSGQINIDETINYSIYQQELVNLLSFYYNYSFTVNLPINFFQHKYKRDFFPSVMMVLKCSNANDMVEFTFNCLFPIIEQYLNTQQDEPYAIRTMESIFHSFRLFRLSFKPTVVRYIDKCKSTGNNSQKDKIFIYRTMYQSYETMLNKFIDYINDSRPRSQYFEELLVSIIMLLGCVDYCTSCVVLMKWKPKFKPSTILTRKCEIFKSILGHTLWNRLCVIDDINTIKCLINMCTLKDELYNTLEKLQ